MGREERGIKEKKGISPMMIQITKTRNKKRKIGNKEDEINEQGKKEGKENKKAMTTSLITITTKEKNERKQEGKERQNK